MRRDGALPGEVGRPAHADGLRAGGDRALDARRDRVDVERIDLEGDTPRELVVGPAGGGDHRGPAGHRLQHREPEALVERDVDDRHRAAVQPCELLVVDPFEVPDPVSVDSDSAPAFGSDDAQLEPVEP